MTLEEVNLLKKAILDANEIYIKELLKNAKFNKDEKAVIVGRGTSSGVKVKIKDIEYDNVDTIGRVSYSAGDIVNICIPNNNYNNMYIIGNSNTSYIVNENTVYQYIENFIKEENINNLNTTNKTSLGAINEINNKEQNIKITPILTEGVEIAEIKIGERTIKLYAPTPTDF